MTTLLFQLDIQRARNYLSGLRYNRKDALRLFLFVAWLGYMLWWMVFQHLARRPELYNEHWQIWRFVVPVALGSFAAAFGAYNRQSPWLARWSNGSWGVLPIDPRAIAPWLLGTTFLLDLFWFLFAVAMSVGTAVILNLVWWQEFPFLLLGTLLLIAAATVAKTFATLLLRLGSASFLSTPQWWQKFLGSLLAMLFVQPLIGFWWIAEYARPSIPVVSMAAFAVQAAAIVGLAFAARSLLVSRWYDIAASFERQQTYRKPEERLHLINFIGNRFRSPIARFVTLYNLRTGMQMNQWGGQQVTLGGRRLTMLVIFFFIILFMLSGMILPGAVDPDDMLFPNMFGAVWASMSAALAFPPAHPAYRLLRQLPVSFPQWLWSMAAFPLFYSGTLVVVAAVGMVLIDPTVALRSCAIVFGVFLGIVPLRLAMLSAFPEGQQTTEFVYMLILGAAGLSIYFMSWMAAAPLLLAANVYFYYRAAREWRGREEGLHA